MTGKKVLGENLHPAKPLGRDAACRVYTKILSVRAQGCEL